jgi:predicted signal transduction protein with EAL and GGDEF domain
VAKRLSGEVRASDTVACLGGDEFLVLAVDLGDALEAVQLAERIDRALTGPVMLGGVEVDVTASIGIALYPEHGEDVSTLLKRADVAMYDAKRARQPYSVYTADLDPYTAERLALVAELRHAIERRELTLHYQPKYELGTRKLCGAEALVRWTHPTRGPMPPAEFIPVAEHTGLIRALTDLVLDKALEEVRRWRDADHAVPVSVNLSPRSLLDNELPGRVGDALARHGVPADLLSLEITESVIMEDPQRALTILTTLSEMGIRLGIDDFGTGYSSLAYLKQLPVAELKIDRSFVMNMSVSEEDAAIVRSTIDLGHNLGLDVVAEGVEDEATLDELSRLACETAQGFFLARPQGPEQISALLAETRATDAA